MGNSMTRKALVGLAGTLGVLGVVTLVAWPGEAARPDLIRPILADLRQFDTLYLTGRHMMDVNGHVVHNTVFVYAAGDGRMTIDMTFHQLRYYFNGQDVVEDSTYTRTDGRSAPHMPAPSSLKPVIETFLDQASRGFPGFGIIDEPPPGFRAGHGNHYFHFVPTLPVWPEVYLHMDEATRKIDAATVFLTALGLTDATEEYVNVDDLSFDVPVPVGTFQEMRVSEPCWAPNVAVSGRCVPPHMPLSAASCCATCDSPETDCEFVHPPSHPASEFAAGGECHKDEHGDRNDHRECGDDHDDDNDDPGDGEEHDDQGGGGHGGDDNDDHGSDHGDQDDHGNNRDDGGDHDDRGDGGGDRYHRGGSDGRGRDRGGR